MKRVTLTIALMICCIIISAQVPQGFNYQAVARDESKNPVTVPISVRFTIQSDSLGGTVFWVEEHLSVIPNENGMFNVVIGKGTRISGLPKFSDIDWTVKPKFIMTHIDHEGWKLMGSARLWTVPYAMVADSLGGPLKKLSVEGVTTNMEEALFEVKNTAGKTVFAVYNEGVRVYVADGDAKGVKGGFAVGSMVDAKAGDQNYLFVSGDSIRAYVFDDPVIKAVKGGFAVSGFNNAKKQTNDYLLVSPDSVRVFIDKAPSTKAPKGGFAVSGFGNAKAVDEEYLRVTRDSTRIYINDLTGKAAKGGFAVSGFANAKGSANFFNVATDANDIINPSQNRILWYPLKNAFLTGRVLVENRDSVGENSFASGYESKAKGMYSQALGYKAIARGDYATAIGKNAIANKINSFAIGENAKAINEESYAFGRGSVASGYRSFAFGSAGIDKAGIPTDVTRAVGDYSFALGQGSKAVGKGSLAIGLTNTAVSELTIPLPSIAIGAFTKAVGIGSIAIGINAEANGMLALAMGMQAKANGDGAISIGGNNASGYYSLAMGTMCIANNTYSFAIGIQDTASGYGSTALGYKNKASGGVSTALGFNNFANGEYSTVSGRENRAMGWGSTAMGHINSANESGSTAFGWGNKANGIYSTAIGYFNEANGLASVSFGANNQAIGKFSTSMGNFTKAKSILSLTMGRFNDTICSISPDGSEIWVETDPLFIVGNGTSDLARSNAFTILKNGNTAIGHSSPTQMLDVNGSARFRSVISGTFAYNLNLTSDGTLTTATSDLNMKENIQQISNALDKVNRLRGVTFTWKSDSTATRQIGMIAQEVVTVVPEIVFTNQVDGLRGINYSQATALLVEAIKEQQQQIESYKLQLQSLQQEVEQIKTLLTTIGEK